MPLTPNPIPQPLGRQMRQERTVQASISDLFAGNDHGHGLTHDRRIAR